MQKVRKHENVSVVVEAKEKSTKEIYLVFEQVFITQRSKRMV